MNMLAVLDAATIAAIFTGLATLIAALGAFALSWKAAVSAAAAQREAAEAKAKTVLVVDKTDALLIETGKIHTLTNDAKSKADAALAVANETIKGLQLLNASLAGPKNATPPRPDSPHPFPPTKT